MLFIISCTEQKVIELPLTEKGGYGYFHYSLRGIMPYSDDEDNPWAKTYLNVKGAPENWIDIKYGDIETNIYQSVYQNYLLGNITSERFEEMQKAWDWKPDTLKLSKEPIKTKIAFAYVNDSTEGLKMIVDANNNLDFSDDEIFVPFERSTAENLNKDSLALSNAMNVTYEHFLNNKVVKDTVSLFIEYMEKYNMFMGNFPQYLVTNFKRETIAVCSESFTNLSYKNPSITLVSDTLKIGDKIDNGNLIAKNEYIEIDGKLYKNLGVNLNKNNLKLERVDKQKSELHSTQIGFKPFPFEGNIFRSDSTISLNDLKGKYVLLDFWAVWCRPCLQEIPNLKALYEKTDREKFEIVSIVGESPLDALREIIKKDTIRWPQIISTDTNMINETYGINGYPTTFLLNQEGTIIAKNIRGEELEEKVMKLLNE
jgi:thiol-disulfide isomerase/thioredoxin